jgi:hypothetical protein
LEENGLDMENEENNMENTFEQAFGWFAVINRLSEDDLTRHTKILQITILEALNQLLYLIEKDKELTRRQKEILSKR